MILAFSFSIAMIYLLLVQHIRRIDSHDERLLGLTGWVHHMLDMGEYVGCYALVFGVLILRRGLQNRNRPLFVPFDVKTRDARSQPLAS